MRENRVYWIIAAFLMINSIGFSQKKFEFGLSFRGSVGLITNKKQNIDRIFNTLHVTKYEGKVSENQKYLWTTSEISFDVQLPNRKWEFSAGLRSINWHYNRDYIIRHYPEQVNIDTQYGPWTIVAQKPAYAFSKRALSTILPFVGASYISALTKKSEIAYTLSIGYYGLFERKAERNFAYYENFQPLFDNKKDDQNEYNYNKQLNSYAFDCKLSTDYRIRVHESIQFSAGLSYYYAQNGLAMHHGLYANAGLSVRFKKLDPE